MRLFFGAQWCTSNKATHIRKGMKYKKKFFFTSRKQPWTVQIKCSPARSLAEHRASAKLSQTLHKHSQQNSLARPRRDIFAGWKTFPLRPSGQNNFILLIFIFPFCALASASRICCLWCYRTWSHLCILPAKTSPPPTFPLPSTLQPWKFFIHLFFCSLIKPKKNTLSKKKTAWKKKQTTNKRSETVEK